MNITKTIPTEVLCHFGEKYFIEALTNGVANGGMSCSGWHPGPRVAEMKVRTDEEAFYLSISEVEGCPYFFKTKDSVFSFLIEEPDDEQAWDNLHKSEVASGMSIWEVFDMESENELIPLFVILYVASGMTTEGKMNVGKKADIFFKDKKSC